MGGMAIIPHRGFPYGLPGDARNLPNGRARHSPFYRLGLTTVIDTGDDGLRGKGEGGSGSGTVKAGGGAAQRARGW